MGLSIPPPTPESCTELVVEIEGIADSREAGVLGCLLRHQAPDHGIGVRFKGTLKARPSVLRLLFLVAVSARGGAAGDEPEPMPSRAGRHAAAPNTAAPRRDTPVVGPPPAAVGWQVPGQRVPVCVLPCLIRRLVGRPVHRLLPGRKVPLKDCRHLLECCLGRVLAMLQRTSAEGRHSQGGHERGLLGERPGNCWGQDRGRTD
mmetsp:Transcript_37166/g.87129  ORF Transcript_37166/g.87129 Transcript_37166/m.87129 type:complete len:203 (-) Transcript_37166:133-741(-)